MGQKKDAPNMSLDNILWGIRPRSFFILTNFQEVTRLLLLVGIHFKFVCLAA